jgi:hypothetical protein
VPHSVMANVLADLLDDNYWIALTDDYAQEDAQFYKMEVGIADIRSLL